MSDETKYYGYFGVRWLQKSDTEKDQIVQGFCLSNRRESVQEFVNADAKAKSEVESKDSSDSQSPPETRSESITMFCAFLKRALDSNLAQKELQSFTNFASQYIPQQLLRDVVVRPIAKLGVVIENSADCAVYGLSEDDFQRALTLQRSESNIGRGLRLLPSAAFMSAVSTFDSLIADVFRGLLTLCPDRYFSADYTISASELTSAKSFDDLKKKIVDDEVYRFSRGSHEEQTKTLETKFSVDIRSKWERWSAFVEVFERRNLVAHGEATFTQRYVNICGKAGNTSTEKRLGRKVILPEDYLSESLDVMLEFSLLLLLSLWRKQFKDEESAIFDEFSQCCYDVIKKKRYKVAERVLRYALGLKGTGLSDSTRKVMTINLASTCKHQGNVAEAMKILDSTDWSACADRYVMSVEALRENMDKVFALLARVAKSNDITVEEFKEWPLFSFVRKNQDFRERFASLFGVPVVDDQQVDCPTEATSQPDRAAKPETEPKPVTAMPN